MRSAACFMLALTLAAGFAAAEDLGLDLPVEPGGAELPVKPKPSTVSATVQPPKKAPDPPKPTVPLPPVELPPTFYGKDLDATSGTIAYVVDCSGSMSTSDNGAATRLTRAKSELVRSIRSLPASFRFQIVAYECVYREFKASLVPASGANKAEATAWVDALEAGGATGTGPATYWTLYRYNEAKLVLLLTDGAPNCGAGSGEDGDPACLAAHRSQIRCGNEDHHARIDVFGIGAYGAFRSWLLTIAADNGGSYVDAR